MGTTSVDPQALHLAAQRLDAAADLLQGALNGHLAGLCAAGPLRAALDGLLADLALWQRTAQDTAAALRVSADRYVGQEAHAVGLLR